MQQNALQKQPNQDSQGCSTAQYHPDHSIQNQMNACRRQFNVNARSHEESGTEKSDSRDVFLANLPDSDEDENRRSGKSSE
jgi:hypothetical protein